MARITAAVIVIYAIGMIVLLGLTVRDLYPLFVAYLDNNIATEIYVVPYDQSSIESPPLVLCLSYDRESSSSLSKAQNDLVSLNGSVNSSAYKSQLLVGSWNGTLEVDWNAYPSANDYKNAIKAQILKDLFYDHVNENVFEFSSSQFGKPRSRQVFDAAWDFLSCLDQIDAAFPNTPPSKCTSFFPPQFPDNWRIQTILDRILDEAAVTINCYQPNTTAQCQNRTDRSLIKSMLNEQALLGFDYSGQMCFSLHVPAQGLTLASGRWKTIGQPLPNQPIFPFRIFEATPESMLQLLTQSTSNVSAYRLLYQSPPTDPAGVIARETVHMQYRTSIKVTEKREGQPCFMEYDLATCISKCKLEKIVKNCSCIPFAYRNAVLKQQYLPYCSPDSNQFRKGCTPVISDLTCERTCGDTPCSYTFFDWQITSSVVEKTAIQGGLALSIAPVQSPYLQFSVVYKQTLEQFLSSVFGIFNFYIGIDGLYFCAFAVIVANLIGGACVPKPKPSNIANEVMDLRVSRNMFEEVIGGTYATKQDLERMQNAIDAKFTEQNETIDYLCRLTDAMTRKPRWMRKESIKY